MHPSCLIQFCYQPFAAVDVVGGFAIYGFADTPAKWVVLVAGYFSLNIRFNLYSSEFIHLQIIIY
ncbi:hypothetical protein BHC43_01295 [Snodgrassella alvi]|nr:hypothetical protein BHC43_01295 [Snodgrassella alvi]